MGVLEADGRTALAVNLPGRGGDPRPATEMTLGLGRDAVPAAMEGVAEPLVLVGHYFGGVTVSTVAEAAPERIAKAIYVAVYVLQDGETLLGVASTDAESQLGPHLRIDESAATATVAEEARVGTFCADCPAEVQAGFAATMVAEPATPQTQPVTLTERFGAVPKADVRTALDRVVSPALQDRMIASVGIAEVVTLETGHAPFLVEPEGLAQALQDLAAS